tara:strand:- start:15 stop:215 length:201 start_codon:yes stop_codon:yes gene_type:complete
MSNNKDIDMADIIRDVVNLTQPKPQADIEKQIQADKINYLVWQVDVAVKELQAEVDKLKEISKEAM